MARELLGQIAVGAVAFAGPLVLVVAIMNVAGWLRTRGGPFNWRVLLGPDLYYRWLDRRTPR